MRRHENAQNAALACMSVPIWGKAWSHGSILARFSRAMPRTAPLWILAVSLLLQGCAYRFSNAHIQSPEGIRTIAIEAIYDTSREVLPHASLWGAFQDAFAADGKLRLAPAEKADALLRAHIKQARISSAGTLVRNKPEKDPDPSQQLTPSPKDLKLLTQAGELHDQALVRASIEVEIVNLRTRSVLLKRTYDLAQNFRAIHSDAAQTVTTRSNDFLRYEEARNARFQAMARDLANRVVSDLLIR